ncbi:hypothetical protein [Pedobacter puniceum]|uniref:Outer membrane beta-barrel protein n=1 Tax=Pedobacter puniceum TaxID=2666136 RepID=A0A7K0FM46_9SPHI|nr:hypothetical protein [Pedobacter puniceum]MRX46495.1 hypothetical protein [Pedobacter puniceum]
MKAFKLLISLIVLAISLPSCVTYLTPSMTGDNNIGYLPRPFSKDTIKRLNYISAEYSSSSAPSGDLNFNLGMLNISKGHTLKHINFGYGAFVFLGNANYENDSTISKSDSDNPINNFNKFLYGGGLRTTIGFHVTEIKNLDLRILNWENAFSIEKGDYANYRKEIYRSTLSYPVYVSNLDKFFTTGLSSEILWNPNFLNKNLQIGLRLFVGITSGLNKSFINKDTNQTDPDMDYRAVSFNSFIKYKKIFSTLQMGAEHNLGAKIALGYSF